MTCLIAQWRPGPPIVRLEQCVITESATDGKNVLVLRCVIDAKRYNLLCSLTAPIKPPDKAFAGIVEILQNRLSQKSQESTRHFSFYKVNHKKEKNRKSSF